MYDLLCFVSKSCKFIVKMRQKDILKNVFLLRKPHKADYNISQEMLCFCNITDCAFPAGCKAKDYLKVMTMTALRKTFMDIFLQEFLKAAKYIS